MTDDAGTAFDYESNCVRPGEYYCCAGDLTTVSCQSWELSWGRDGVLICDMCGLGR